ncbi:PIGC [Symbiodinium sp. CCMP2592]|nr:PIGC [Symbiodinium sp. CCMP2592]
MDSAPSLTSWSKVLYLQQPFEDNYVDDSFLNSLVLNAHVTRYELQELCCSTTSIIRQLCLVVIFVNVWWKAQLEYDFRWLFAVGGLLFSCYLWHCVSMRPLTVVLKVLQVGAIVFPLGVLAPLLQALTRSWSDDTIGVFACGLLLLHVILYDYGDGSSASVWSCRQELFLPGGPIALNASVLSAMILASRLRTPLEVFAFMSFAMEVFALPHFCGRSTACVLPFLFAVAIALDFKSGVSLLLAGILIGLVGPVLFLSAQHLKTEIQGPWDIAHVVPETLEGTLGQGLAADSRKVGGGRYAETARRVPNLIITRAELATTNQVRQLRYSMSAEAERELPKQSQAYPNPREGLAAEKLAMEERPAPGMHDLPLRQYLDTYVVPTLLPGMNAVAEERPENPVEWLAYYLLKNNTMGKKPSEEKKADDAAPEQ